MRDEESRGPPINVALRIVIDKLRRVFAKHYRGPPHERINTGSVSNLSERENDEIEFVSVALNDAGIEYPENIRSLFDGAPAIAGGEVRQEAVERLAKKAHRRRTAADKDNK